MVYCKLVLAILSISLGMLVFIAETIGVFKWKKPLNRLHVAALGDTLGIFLVMFGLILWKGFSFVSLKLLAVILFFWFASPVSSHMLARFEAETDENLGEMEVEKK